MKRLWEYKPGNARGSYSLNESKVQKEIIRKTKTLLEKKK